MVFHFGATGKERGCKRLATPPIIGYPYRLLCVGTGRASPLTRFTFLYSLCLRSRPYHDGHDTPSSIYSRMFYLRSLGSESLQGNVGYNYHIDFLGGYLSVFLLSPFFEREALSVSLLDPRSLSFPFSANSIIWHVCGAPVLRPRKR